MARLLSPFRAHSWVTRMAYTQGSCRTHFGRGPAVSAEVMASCSVFDKFASESQYVEVRRATLKRELLQLLLVVLAAGHGVLAAMPHNHAVAGETCGSAEVRLAAVRGDGHGSVHHGCVACVMAAAAYAVGLCPDTVVPPQECGCVCCVTPKSSSAALTTTARARAPPITFPS